MPALIIGTLLQNGTTAELQMSDLIKEQNRQLGEIVQRVAKKKCGLTERRLVFSDVVHFGAASSLFL